MSSYRLPNPLSSLESPSLADTNEVSCGMRGSPDLVVGVTFRDFNPLHRSFLKWFPLFIWLLFAVSLVSNFRPGTGGRRWSLI